MNRLFADLNARLIARRADWINAALVALGPVFIKIGQIAATRGDLLPADVCRNLQSLQDNVPPMDRRALSKQLDANFPRGIGQVFRSFDSTPVAQASLAQVHRAELHDGSVVAVKIRRRGVEGQIRANLALIKVVLRALCALSGRLRSLCVNQKFDELAGILLEQIDLRQEAENAERIRANFEGNPHVFIPRTYLTLCSEAVLVQEFVEGRRGRDFDSIDHTPAELAKRFQDAIYTMVYHHGVAHADPHPGNVFWLRDGRVAFVDFGLVARMSEGDKWSLSSFYFSCVRREWAIAARRFIEQFTTGLPPCERSRAAMQLELQQVIQKHFEQRASRWSTIAFYNDFQAILYRHGARYTTGFSKVEMSFLSGEGFLTDIDPGIDIWQNARLFTDAYSPYLSDSIQQGFEEEYSNRCPGSLALRQQAEQHLVAPVHLHRYFVPSNFPLFIEETGGAHIVDVDGNRFLDFSGGFGPHVLGYNPPVVAEAIRDGLARGQINALSHRSEIELADEVTAAYYPTDAAERRLIFCNSGTEAVMQALKLARTYRPRANRIVKFEGHYHGQFGIGTCSSWFRFAGSISEPEPQDNCRGEQANDNTIILQYGMLDHLQRLEEIADEISAVIVEPLPSSSCTLDAEFLRQLRSVTRRCDIPLIFDEVVTGMRIAYGGVATLTGIYPDMAVFGKVIGGGLPCGAVAGHRRLIELAKTTKDPFADFEEKTFLGGTMSGNRLTMLAGLAAVRHLRDNPGLYSRLQDSTAFVVDRLRRIAAERNIPIQVAGFCSILGFNFRYRSASYYRQKASGSLFRANLALCYYLRRYGIYLPEIHSLLISTAHTRADLEHFCDSFANALDEMIGDGVFDLFIKRRGPGS